MLKGMFIAATLGNATDYLSLTSNASSTAGNVLVITVTAKTPSGAVDTTYTGTVHFTSNDVQAVLPGDYTFVGGDAGVKNFNVTLKTSGTMQVTVTDTLVSSITGYKNISVTAAGAASFTVSGLPNPYNLGTSQNLTVTAKDIYNNTATGYGGTVHLTSSDGAAILAGDSVLTNGTKNFAVTLNTFGVQSVTATDTLNGALTGTQTNISVVYAPITNTKSLLFNGVDGYTSAPHNAILNCVDYNKPFTIVAWIKKTLNAASDSAILGKLDLNGAAKGWFFAFRNSGIGSSTPDLFIINNYPTNLIRVKGTVDIPNANWHHLVATYDGSQSAAGVALYVDGVATATTTDFDTLSASVTSADALTIGRLSGIGNDADGYIDEVSLYDIGLNAAQVAATYNNGVMPDLSALPTAAHLVAWYRMGDGDTAPTIQDHSGNGINMTMYNGVTISAVVP